MVRRPKAVFLLHGLAVGLGIAGLTTCNHPTGLLQLDAPYTLRTINGRALPVSMNGMPDGPVLLQGSVTFFSAGRAARFQRTGRRNGSAADTAFSEWTQTGIYYSQLGRVIVRYDDWPPVQGGPPAEADTLENLEGGGFLLRQMGLMLKFCPGTTSC